MSRLMALDIGQKRTGIAITDVERIIATGLTTVKTKDLEAYLAEYLSKNDVETIVVGLPMQLNNTESESVKYIKPQFNRLRKVFSNISFVYYDERFTSKLSHDAMLMGGLKKKARQNKELVDQTSAVLILQGYMDYIENANKNS
ncbi:MAG: Holliday junction resolvase RuvX [Bacteroidales bacterium]|jgi:putative Holliday junction resolvase|nr:Holliday junction resolvase RuvX [Bacteroidales bacterium]MDD4234599.1 Holliday junction resolvase RuvX [Bacteroidales bacterium]MDY0161324.1 Holliday junction resolvase RuvX [Bacteroidales bacterium]